MMTINKWDIHPILDWAKTQPPDSDNKIIALGHRGEPYLTTKERIGLSDQSRRSATAAKNILNRYVIRASNPRNNYARMNPRKTVPFISHIAEYAWPTVRYVKRLNTELHSLPKPVQDLVSSECEILDTLVDNLLDQRSFPLPRDFADTNIAVLRELSLKQFSCSVDFPGALIRNLDKLVHKAADKRKIDPEVIPRGKIQQIHALITRLRTPEPATVRPLPEPAHTATASPFPVEPFQTMTLECAQPGATATEDDPATMPLSEAGHRAPKTKIRTTAQPEDRLMLESDKPTAIDRHSANRQRRKSKKQRK